MNQMSSLERSDILHFRRLRHDFAAAALEVGREALEHIASANPHLSARLSASFPSEGRAAFWLATDIDPGTGRTPLQQLGRNELASVMARLPGPGGRR